MLPDPVTLNDSDIQRNVVSNEVTLSWNKYQGTDFREYKLYQHSSSGLDETTGELLHVATTANDMLFATTLPHSSETYFRVFVRDNFGLLGGSNIVEVPIGVYESDPEIIVGIESSYCLSADEEQELYFDTPSAGLYSIAWFDSWFNDYAAGSIVVAAYNNDKSTTYFQNERLIQMNESPLPIFVPSNERVNLGIDHYDDRYPGTYGDGAATFLSIYKESADAFHTYKEPIPFPMGTPTKTIEVNYDSTTMVFLIIDSAYWVEDNSVNIIINEL